MFIERGYDGATLNHLARASALSKASLYHHFPGGKPEMAATLVRNAIAELQRQAFTPQTTPKLALANFVTGFANYVDQGRSDCILAVFSHHSTAHTELDDLQGLIRTQFSDWHEHLATLFIQLGRKPKRARREAHSLISAAYGALMNAKLQQDAKLFAKSMERLALKMTQE